MISGQQTFWTHLQQQPLILSYVHHLHMSGMGSHSLLADLSLDSQSSTSAEITLNNLGTTEIGHYPALRQNWQVGSAVLVSDRDCLPGAAGYVGRRVSFE
jgi:hypothetical protein